MKNILNKGVKELVKIMWEADPAIRQLLKQSESLAEARKTLMSYLADQERLYFNIYSDRGKTHFHICERNNAKECIRAMKNIIRSENEQNTGLSALKILRKLAADDPDESIFPSEGFIMEFIYLFRGINAQSNITQEILTIPEDPEKAASMRSRRLNAYAKKMETSINLIPKGTDPQLEKEFQIMKERILKYFKASEHDWYDYHWQMKHIISDLKTVKALVKLSPEEEDGLRSAEERNIPFQITPYYFAMFSPEGPSEIDRAIRAQVIPSRNYCERVADNKMLQVDMDFMGEKSTSPIHGITRRYPQIVILKPIDTCPQICVYCQRNWEIKSVEDSGVSSNLIYQAINWIRDNKHITEVLVTGGDPLMLPNGYLKKILSKLAEIDHVERIRIGTRIPVTLPYRITPELIALLKEHHEFGKREVCVVTHVEHPTEITADFIQSIRMIREAGMSVYNQQVFTYFNSRKYETSALRRVLKVSGVDPYYSFNTKGKAETEDFRVPIARIQQERKEEARFLPGMVRTDEPVFNVPKLGKSHLRAWQDHEVTMITPAGERIYRFYPWESRVTFVDDYLYTDTSIYDYLKRLQKDGEDPERYGTIWYYF
ncbi:MAG: KamA family radical SAM protein [Bacteroidales bacterium]|nr:KamA family radical SAM protein [Bacteroidales bacterium]MDD4813055.1 KamA family radical SAM protein [Bacteroidales bacterium]